MAIALLIAGAAERDAVQQRAVVADHGRLADDDAGSMSEHHTSADTHRRMNVDLENARRQALQIEGEGVTPGVPYGVREAVCLQRMKAFEIEERIDQPPARGIALGNGDEVGAEDVAETGLRLKHLVESLMQQTGVNGVIEALRQAVADGVLEGRLAQDRGIDQA